MSSAISANISKLSRQKSLILNGSVIFSSCDLLCHTERSQQPGLSRNECNCLFGAHWSRPFRFIWLFCGELGLSSKSFGSCLSRKDLPYSSPLGLRLAIWVFTKVTRALFVRSIRSIAVLASATRAQAVRPLFSNCFQ
jgi:hypothetical protein